VCALARRQHKPNKSRKPKGINDIPQQLEHGTGEAAVIAPVVGFSPASNPTGGYAGGGWR
jgi:hypothetical protein